MDGMADAGMTMAIWPGADPHLFKEFIWRHEGRDDLHRGWPRFGIPKLFPDTHCGAGGTLMRHHRMASVRLILYKHFPVTFVHVA